MGLINRGARTSKYSSAEIRDTYMSVSEQALTVTKTDTGHKLTYIATIWNSKDDKDNGKTPIDHLVRTVENIDTSQGVFDLAYTHLKREFREAVDDA